MPVSASKSCAVDSQAFPVQPHWGPIPSWSPTGDNKPVGRQSLPTLSLSLSLSLGRRHLHDDGYLSAMVFMIESGTNFERLRITLMEAGHPVRPSYGGIFSLKGSGRISVWLERTSLDEAEMSNAKVTQKWGPLPGGQRCPTAAPSNRPWQRTSIW